jgi:uncharacterized protein (DUF169 family)
MARQNFVDASRQLTDLLGLNIPPIAITFTSEEPVGVASFGRPYPAPTLDGRTGAVPAGCVFWIHAINREFQTSAADHRNCSVGSYTHGFTSLQEAVGHADVQALLAAEWVTPNAAAGIPTVSVTPRSVVYAPLASTSLDPDIVLLRVNGKQLMLLHDAWAGLRFEGKPQCHIIPLAKNTGEIAVSSGCMLSRVRTGMSNNEVTCAIPASRLNELIEKLRAANKADMAVAAYAAEDGRRFAST